MDQTERKNAVKNRMLPIADAWALVAMADRINEGCYVKFPEFDQETGNVKFRPNRQIIEDQIELGQFGVTDADRKFGAILAEHFQGLVFDALGGKTNEFEQQIINLITAEEVHARHGIAYMACLANRYHKEIVKDARREQMFKIGHTSIHQGAIGQHLRLNVRIISKYAGRAFPGSVVRATDGQNLYFWTSSKEVDMWPDAPEEFPIVGIVKSHGIDNEQYQETRLTRVKIAM